MSFLGMRGNDDWVTDQRPLNWRQQILYLYPNGDAPLTAILSMMAEEKVDDPQFHWWTQNFAHTTGDVTGVFTRSDLSVTYGGGGAAGDTVFVQVGSTLAGKIRAGHQVLLRDASDWLVDVNGKVTNVIIDGANSVITVKLLEADDNSGDHDLQNCDTLMVNGNINPEGGEMPSAVQLDPVKYYNYTQIFRTPLAITRTARLTRLRTGDQYQKAKKECLEMHSVEMELAMLWGIMTENIGDNGKPERTTRGIIPWIRTVAPGNVGDYTTDTDFAGDAWTTGGEEWLDRALELAFRYGSSEKLALCGSGALLGINRLAKQGGQINLQPTSKVYGMQVNEWVTPFGSIYAKRHPLLSYDPTTRNMMVIIEPKEFTFKYITDTSFYGESNSKMHPEGYGQGRIDGTIEEYLTEAGLEFGHPLKCAILNGVNCDNDLP
jgi:hypothetical protein